MLTLRIVFMMMYTAHLEKKKKSPLARNASDPNYLPPVNLSREEESLASNQSQHSNGPRSNSSYLRAANRYKKATKAKVAVAKSPVKSTKSQLPRLNQNRTQSKYVPKKRVYVSDDDSDDEGVYHRETKPPPSLNKNDKDCRDGDVDRSKKSVTGGFTSSSNNATSMAISLNLESVKEKLARMEEQLVIRRKVRNE